MFILQTNMSHICTETRQMCEEHHCVDSSEASVLHLDHLDPQTNNEIIELHSGFDMSVNTVALITSALRLTPVTEEEEEEASHFITHTAADPIMEVIFVTGTHCAGSLNVDMDSSCTVHSTPTLNKQLILYINNF